MNAFISKSTVFRKKKKQQQNPDTNIMGMGARHSYLRLWLQQSQQRWEIASVQGQRRGAMPAEPAGPQLHPPLTPGPGKQVDLYLSPSLVPFSSHATSPSPPRTRAAVPSRTPSPTLSPSPSPSPAQGSGQPSQRRTWPGSRTLPLEGARPSRKKRACFSLLEWTPGTRHKD